jgi:hypothetical protein
VLKERVGGLRHFLIGDRNEIVVHDSRRELDVDAIFRCDGEDSVDVGLCHGRRDGIPAGHRLSDLFKAC